MQIPGLHGLNPLDLLKRSFRAFTRDDMPTYASALSYTALFALFPFLIFLIALLGFLQIPGFFDWLLAQAETAMPDEAFQLFQDVIDQIRDQANGGLLSIGILLALWAASGGVRSVMNAMNVAFDVEESRAMWKRYVLSVVYTIGIAGLLVSSAAVMLLGPDLMQSIADEVGLGNVFLTVWSFLRWLVLAILLILAVALIYYVAPNVDQPFALITPGAVIAVVVWILASAGFSIYVSNFADYSATYGSLGGIIVLMMFFFISSLVLLLGAEINAVIYRVKLGEPEPQD
ncbi:YihY/virulence factor BrkB family protein [soil metagenome]